MYCLRLLIAKIIRPNSVPMQLLDFTYDSVVENIALDEALLLHSEETGSQFLRFWKPEKYAVVMGRSGKLEQEAVTENCQLKQIPVYRRPSGGGTILTGPGCLMYAAILNSHLNPSLQTIQGCHDYVLSQMCEALRVDGIQCEIRGFSDLVIGDLKFSGNSLRLKKNSVLYHGTLLCDFELESISSVLLPPPKQPDYRQNREHGMFVTNLERRVEAIQQTIENHWEPESRLDSVPAEVEQLMQDLLASRYRDDQWSVFRPEST